VKRERKREVTGEASLLAQSWPGSGGAVLLDRPDTEYERGRRVGLGDAKSGS